MTDVENVKLESDERGFELHLVVDEEPKVDEQGRMILNVHSCAEALYEQVNLIIGSWLSEGRAAAAMPASAVFRCNPNESGGYDTSDPKHPDWHSIHADIWDARAGK